MRHWVLTSSEASWEEESKPSACSSGFVRWCWWQLPSTVLLRLPMPTPPLTPRIQVSAQVHVWDRRSVLFDSRRRLPDRAQYRPEPGVYAEADFFYEREGLKGVAVFIDGLHHD